MLDVLKRFGLGIFYALISPFVLAFFLGYTLYTIVIFFIKLFKSIVSFFKGKNFFSLTEEEIKANEILEKATQAEPTQNNNTQNNSTVNININSGITLSELLNLLNKNEGEFPTNNKQNTPEIDMNNKKELTVDTSNKNNNGGNQQ